MIRNRRQTRVNKSLGKIAAEQNVHNKLTTCKRNEEEWTAPASKPRN